MIDRQILAVLGSLPGFVSRINSTSLNTFRKKYIRKELSWLIRRNIGLGADERSKVKITSMMTVQVYSQEIYSLSYPTPQSTVLLQFL